MQDLGMEIDFSSALETPSYTSSPESTSQPKTPDKINPKDIKQFHFSHHPKEIDICWSEDLLDRELELMMADTETVEWKDPEENKRPAEDDFEVHSIKRQKVSLVESEQAKESQEDIDIKRSFMILRDNYINLCQGYNTLLEKYQESESDRCQMVLEREQSKSLISSLSNEVNQYRRREREKSFGKPKVIRMGHSTVTDRLLQ